jgi:hypothetical protein
MGLLARIRRSRVRLARVAGVLFTASWLGLAFAPCQAAASGASHHVEPGHAPAMHHGSAGEPPCPHCPAPVPDDCGSATTAHCVALQKPALEQRDAKVALATMPGVAWLPVAPVTVVTRYGLPATRAVLPPCQASLQQRFCTYLK